MEKMIIIILCLLLIINISTAGVKTWVGGQGSGGQKSQWNRDANWNPTGVPVSSDSVVIPLTSFNPVNMNSASGFCGALTLAGGSIYLSGNLNINSNNGHGGHLSIISGTFTATDYAASIQGNLINDGTISVGSGTISVNGDVTMDGTITYATGRMNVVGALMRNNLSGTGVKLLFSANNYIDITTAGITSITIQAFANTTSPDTLTNYNASKGVKRYYTISNIVGTGEARPRFDYLTSELGSTFIPTNANVWQYKNSGPWVNQGTLIAVEYFAEPLLPLNETNLLGNYLIADAEVAMPIQLGSFVGSFMDGSGIKLEWTTLSEINNYGFNVQRYNRDAMIYENIGFVEGNGTTLEPKTYIFFDESFNVSVEYRLEQIDNDGLINYYGPLKLNPNNVREGETVLAVFKLNQNYPNPFNPATTISFSISDGGYTTLKVFNMLGQEVTTLFNENAEEGKMYIVNFDASTLSSGLYFYRLQNGNNEEVKKFTLLK
ncbi:MAG: T9SS type A sorting domain-containing protein [Bacteroidota bacterium]|nr:T9SS type A sorting domain-containing protein [Bacteroidota bacterium]